jgi:hypothetical protein
MKRHAWLALLLAAFLLVPAVTTGCGYGWYEIGIGIGGPLGGPYYDPYDDPYYYSYSDPFYDPGYDPYCGCWSVAGEPLPE